MRQVMWLTSDSDYTTHNSIDVLGQKINTLVNSQLDAGVHTVTCNGTDYSGGHVASAMYFYRLQAGNHAETRKMLLLK